MVNVVTRVAITFLAHFTHPQPLYFTHRLIFLLNFQNLFFVLKVKGKRASVRVVRLKEK
jgi:hypothetical protein